MKENFVKDRKVFVAATASFLGYLVLIYNILYVMGYLKLVPFQLLPTLIAGEPLANLVTFCTFFMVLRITQRITWVGLTYGLAQGLMSVPRLIVGNVLNGLASFRALKVFADSRSGKAAVRWDNTAHLEGIGNMAGDEGARKRAVIERVPIEQVMTGLISKDVQSVVRALHQIPEDADQLERAEVISYMRNLVSSPELRIRAAVAQTVGRLTWNELTPTLFTSLNDEDPIVLGNAARSLLERPRLGAVIEQAFSICRPRAVQAIIQSIEQDRRRQRQVFELIVNEELLVTKATIIASSLVLRKRFSLFMEGLKSGANTHQPMLNIGVESVQPDAT